MNELFLRVVNMSLTASVIGLAVFLFRAVGKRRLSRWVFYAAWGLVLARLLLPVSVPSPISAFNAIPASHLRAAQQSGEMVFVKDNGAEVSFPTLQTRPAEMPSPALEANEPAVQAPAGQPAAVVAPARIPMITILSTIWLCGVALLLTYSAGCYCYTLHRLKTAERLEHTPELNAIFAKAGIIPACVALYRGGLFDSPVVCGLLRPRLVLSGLVGESDMAHVLAHELTHIRRRDNLWKALATLVLYVHWFNPLIWLFYHFYVIDMEASCDEAVIRGGSDRREYAYSLVGMASKNRSAFAGGFLAFGESALKERVKSIMQIKKNTVVVSIICIAVLAGLTIVFLTNPQNPPGVLKLLDSLDSGKLTQVKAELSGGEETYLPEELFRQVVDAVQMLEPFEESPGDTDYDKNCALRFEKADGSLLTLEYYRAAHDTNDRIWIWENNGAQESFAVRPEKASLLISLISEASKWAPEQSVSSQAAAPESSSQAASSAPAQPPSVPAAQAPAASASELEIARTALKGLRLQDVTDIFVGRDAPNSQLGSDTPKEDWEAMIYAVQNAKFSQTEGYDVSYEPEYDIVFRRAGKHDLIVTFNTRSITISEESGEPVQQHYRYTFEPEIDSLKPLADLCEHALGNSDRYLWTQGTVLRQNNPDYLRIPYANVDCVNLIDRESRTSIRLDPATAERVVLAINMVDPLETKVQPEMKNLRMLQVRYKDGKKAEYWMHSNVFMYQDVQLGTVDRDWHTGIAALYFNSGLPDSREMQGGEAGLVSAEWLGMMNSYRITAMEIGGEAQTRKYSAAAGEEQRDMILQVAQKLQKLSVDPRSVSSGDKQKILSAMESPSMHISLEFENGKEQYTVYFFEDPYLRISVGSIDYYLGYRAEPVSAYQELLNELQFYSVEPKYNPMTAPNRP